MVRDTPNAASQKVIAGHARSHGRQMGIGSWTIIVVLLALLAAAVGFAYFGWTLGAGSMPVSLIIPMVLGVVFSLAVGVGLMALVFYSSRKGYDEPPKEIDRD